MDINISDLEREVFATALRRLNAASIDYVLAGAFCTHFYTGKWRYTKDMDIFTVPEAAPQALEVLSRAGFQTWVEARHWLGKAAKDCCLVDVIYGTGNWLAPVDDIWIQRSRPAKLFGVPVRMASIEEMIWAKSYIAGRERYDGADVCHLVRASGGKLDWAHLLRRFGEHWQLFLTYLNLYGFVYPSHQNDVPEWVISELNSRMIRARHELVPGEPECRGTLLDRFSYNYDVEELGYLDTREQFALAHGATHDDVLLERAWADDKLAKGEVYKKDS